VDRAKTGRRRLTRLAAPSRPWVLALCGGLAICASAAMAKQHRQHAVMPKAHRPPVATQVASARAAADRLTMLAGQEAADRAELTRILVSLEFLDRRRPPDILWWPSDARQAVRDDILAGSLKDELTERERVLAAEIPRLEAERQTLAESAPSMLSAPVAGPVLIGFGAASAEGVRSRGLEIGADPGARVTSPAAAIVDFARDLEGAGEVVILKTADGDHLVLSGLGALVVTRGQSLAAGAPIGQMPAAANAHPRLYFEMRRGLTPVDPGPFIAPPRR
jgi:septal ring factor EnvC (AmiA/AmiB activator)